MNERIIQVIGAKLQVGDVVSYLPRGRLTYCVTKIISEIQLKRIKKMNIDELYIGIHPSLIPDGFKMVLITQLQQTQ